MIYILLYCYKKKKLFAEIKNAATTVDNLFAFFMTNFRYQSSAFFWVLLFLVNKLVIKVIKKVDDLVQFNIHRLKQDCQVNKLLIIKKKPNGKFSLKS
jgi:hypothetical protein